MAKEYFIGDFLKRIKRPLPLNDNQEYKLVTIKMNHNGVVLRGKKKGADIKSNMYEVKEGDFILSGIDARNGAFGIVTEELDGAIVTNDFWYFEIDETIISKKLFLELTATTWFDEICKRGSDGTTQRIRLQKNKFFNQKIILPNGFEQEELLKKILDFKKSQTRLNTEIKTQKQLLTQLKQSILQEAIQGKLTADWREQNSPPLEGCPQDGVVLKRNSKNYFNLPFNAKLKERAKILRKAGNLAEVLFWNKVKRKQFKSLDFDRQKIIGNYIVDFYCPNCNVVIEIDGSSHDDKQEYDAKRDFYLQSLGLTVIHISDTDIKKNLNSTMEWLYKHSVFELRAEQLTEPPRPADTPPKDNGTNLVN